MTPAIVLVPYLSNSNVRVGVPPDNGETEIRTPEACLEEAEGLARAIDLNIVYSEVIRLSSFKPGMLLGRGKVEELTAIIVAHDVELVVVDHSLSPIQQRNLENKWKCKVLDRTAIILEIFGERARTKEGYLQVELAHLNWQKSRLVRSWTHLERQRGGAGFMGGPGETQLESDRRLIQMRISKLEHELTQVKRTRGLHRSQRQKIPHLVVALVGYTNAGKSTLFNRLTKSSVMAENQLFATLDPTLRKTTLPHGSVVLISDTVGFISKLPTFLIAAFQATLEEVKEADVILHVRDISHVDTGAQALDVKNTLEKLGIGGEINKPLIEVWNKSDLLGKDQVVRLRARTNSSDSPVLLSALTGEGIEGVLNRIEEIVTKQQKVRLLSLPHERAGKPLAWLYQHCEVLNRTDSECGVELKVRIKPKSLKEFNIRFGQYIIEPVNESVSELH